MPEVAAGVDMALLTREGAAERAEMRPTAAMQTVSLLGQMRPVALARMALPAATAQANRSR